ncbi:MAG: hypothetical protein GF355_05335 [Candidatus Eisenbacteria bacterium]|nr:hypothetical protein [Candidatus Eisenbacteria bacterium]
MNGRERVLAALDGERPDRIPCALSCFRVELEDLAPGGSDPADLVDVRFVAFPASPEEESLARRALPAGPDTRLGTPAQERIYSRWRYDPLRTVRRNPLAQARTLDDLRRFPFPATQEPNAAGELREQVGRYHACGLAAGGSLPHLGGELFEAAWRLRGLENFLVDLVRRPDWAHLLLDRLADLALRNAATLARSGVDVLTLDDDVGMPGGMMINPATWRAFFKPRYEAILRAARDVNPDLRVIYHSDGFFEPIVGDLVEIGVQAINPLQPEHMDAGRIRRAFGSRLCLWGSVGRQTTFAWASPGQIRRLVRECATSLGPQGLVLCPAYDIDEPDIPWANIAAFCRAVREQGGG